MSKSKPFDNIRSSIDTLYLGFRCDDLKGSEILDIIKDYLSSLCFISLSKGKGNQYYWGSFCNADRGVFLYCEPRKNLKNDYITLQLSGKFFHDIWDSRNFLNMIFSEFSEFLIFQRIDVAVDIMFIEFPSNLPSKDGYLSGFPIPTYNKDYHYRKEGFEVYGRASSNPSIMYFHNMVAQGKKDVRLRVYDKTLDNLEKEGVGYSDVYSFETNYEQVYRIEMQCRGQYLKGFMDKYWDEYKKYDYDLLCHAFITYFFHKYDFDYVSVDDILSEFKKPLTFSKLKKESTLENQFNYHKSRQNKHFFKCCEISDKLQGHRQIARAMGLTKQIVDEVVGDFDMYACFAEFAKLNEKESSNGIKEEN
jgi:hypothetical protein